MLRLTKVIFSLSDTFDPTIVADFHSELKILIHVGENENIVNILGACTKGYDNL